MKQATHFIEVVKHANGDMQQLFPNKIVNLKWALLCNNNMHIETIAIFKIYTHPKPMLAHYDNDLNAIIIE